MNTAKAKLIAAQAKADPVYTIENIIGGGSMWSMQKDIARAVWNNRRVSVRSCNGAGKTYTMSRIAMAWLTTFVNSIVLTTAPTHRQVEEILWREIRKAHSGSPVDLGGKMLKTRWDISDKWYALGMSTNDPTRFQGFHSPKILFLLDESAGIDEAIRDAMEGGMANEGAHMAEIGNPTVTDGAFYRSFRNPNIKRFHISAFDTPNFTTYGITLDSMLRGEWREKVTGPYPAPWLVTPEWVEEMIDSWGIESPMFQARILGEFPKQGAGALIDLVQAEAAEQRILEPDPNHKQIGVDVARYGDNKTVLTYREGPVVKAAISYGQRETMETVGLVVKFMKEFGCPQTMVDVDGVGGGVVDRLLELGYNNVFGIHNNGTPHDKEQYRNIRAEAAWGLRERFEESNISLLPVARQFPQYAAQAASIKWKVTSSGIQLETKEEMMKRKVPSPDYFDSLSLAFLKKPVSKLITKTEAEAPLTAGFQTKVF